jgi:hypothetical protein
LKFFEYVPCKFGPNSGASSCTPVSAAVGYAALAQNMSGGKVALFSSTEGSKSYLSAWEGAGARAACGNKESGFTFAIDDGSGGQNPVTFDLSAATQTALQDALVHPTNGAITKVLAQWFPFLVKQQKDTSAATLAVTCKYAGNLDGDFWNNTPAAITKCENNTGLPNGEKCFDGKGDVYGALHRYKFVKLYNGFSGTDPILGQINYSGKTVAVNSASVKYGYRSWNGSQMGITEIAGLNSSNLDSYRIDVGGCLQWPNWQDQSSSEPKYATVVSVGDYVSWYGPNGEVNKDKCRMSEKRLLYQASDGYIMIKNVKYKDINIFVDMDPTSAENFQETWNKVCQINFDPDGAGTDYSQITEIMSYPVDYDNTKITSEMKNRFNGGDDKQQKGMALDTVYELLTGDGDFGQNQTFYYWNQKTNSGGNVTCNDIKNPPTNQAQAVWDQVGLAFDGWGGSWEKARLLNCAMIGVASGKYSSVNNPPNLSSAYADANNDGLSDIVTTLKNNSCIPKFQLTSLCGDDGFCNSRVICTSMTADNGGCDKAEPAGRFAKMPAEALGGDRYTFMNVEERYDNFFDPSSNKSKMCTRTNAMSITTMNALSIAPALGQKIRLAMEQVESAACEGEATKVMAIPPMYMDFTKN